MRPRRQAAEGAARILHEDKGRIEGRLLSKEVGDVPFTTLTVMLTALESVFGDDEIE